MAVILAEDIFKRIVLNEDDKIKIQIPLKRVFRSPIKDLSMMYRALWDRRHEGATRISQCTRRVAPSALTNPSGPWVPPI